MHLLLTSPKVNFLTCAYSCAKDTVCGVERIILVIFPVFLTFTLFGQTGQLVLLYYVADWHLSTVT